MTYSRPGTGRVSVSSGGGGGNSLQIKLSDPVRRTPDAPYRDRRNPAQAARNVEIQNQGINALLDFATSDVTRKFIADEIDRQAKKEAGEAVDANPGIETTSQNSPAADAAYNALSPRAKDFVTQARTANAVSAYKPALRAQIAASPILTAAGSTDEQRAEAMAKATATAREVSGLTSVPSYQLVVNADKLAQIDGAFRGETYQARTIKEADLAQVGLIQGAASGLAEGWKNLEQVGASDAAGDQPLTTGWRQTLEAVVQTSSNNFGPQGQARILAGGIGEAFTRISDPQEKLEFLQRTQELTATPMLGADGKTDIFSVPLGESGRTIKDVLTKLLPNAEAEADKAIQGKAFVEMEALMSQGRAEEARTLGMSQLEMLNDPSKIPGFIRNIEALTGRTTFQMQRNANTFFDRQLNGESATSLVKEMIQAPIGTVSAQSINQMFALARQEEQGGAVNNPNSGAYSEFENGRTRQRDEFDVGLASYLEYTGIEVKKDAKGAIVETIDYKRERAAFTADVRDRFYAKRAEAQANGSEWDPTDALRDSINETVNAKKDAAPGAGGVATDPKQKYVNWGIASTKTLAKVAASNGGRIDNESIPAAAIVPATLAVWQEANPGKSFDSLTGRQKLNLLAEGIMTFKRYDEKTGQYVNYTQEEAKKKAVEMVEQAERQSADAPAPASERVPEFVPETPEELKQARRPGARGYGNEPIRKTVGLLEKAASWATTKQEDPYNFNKIFNNGGFGPQAMSYVDGFLNMTLGASPAYAGRLDYGTPEGLEALRQSWSSGQQGLNTAPLPQVAAATPVRYAPVAITNDKHELFVMVGVAEGTRTASGGYTKAYYGHRDSGDGNWNRGTVSGGRGSNASPQMVDQRWMGMLTNVQQRMRGPLMASGLEPGTAGFNRVMFNLIDLTVQSPAAARDFAGKLPEMKQKGWTVEAIAKARADSFINPETGRLDAPGFGNNYQRLFKDQRSRAGVYDYRRRI